MRLDLREQIAISNDLMDRSLPITAPLLGTFYVAPEPGAPPFVKVGQQITEDTKPFEQPKRNSSLAENERDLWFDDEQRLPEFDELAVLR